MYSTHLESIPTLGILTSIVPICVIRANVEKIGFEDRYASMFDSFGPRVRANESLGNKGFSEAKYQSQNVLSFRVPKHQIAKVSVVQAVECSRSY